MPNFRKIYLAEDDPDDLMLFEVAMRSEVDDDILSLQTFGDGRLLLNSLEENDVLPDLIVLDINMPRMNGFEALSMIKNNLRWSNIRTVIYSTDRSPYAITRSSSLGADLFLTKPSDFELLRNNLRKVIYYDWQGPDFFNDHIKVLQ